jgi:putative ABC transport system permease protein
MKRALPLMARVLFSLLLLTYPRAFRRRFAVELRQFLLDSYQEHVSGDNSEMGARFWFRTYRLLTTNGFGARLDSYRRRTSRRSKSVVRGSSLVERAAGPARMLRYGARSLRRSPAFAISAALTLGLAIGACTMIFSVVYPVLLSPLPYPRAGQLATLYETSPGPDGRPGWASPLTVRDWQQRSNRFERIASYRLNLFTWTGGPEPKLLRGWAVSSGYFPTMGLPMTLGRGFTPEEDQPGNERVVVLSHAFWNQQFGAQRDVVGKGVTLDGLPYTIVGVAHPDIEFPSVGDYWIPLAIDPSREMRDFRYLGVIGRLREGVGLEDAAAELVQISRQVEAENPETNSGWSAAVRGLKQTEVAGVRPILLGMTVAVGLLLVIAVGNTTNLAIARSSGRQTDVAVRRALGASKSAIAGMHIAESTLVALIGSVLGVLMATWGTRPLASLALGSLPRGAAIEVDTRALAFAVVAALVVGLALGLLSTLASGGNNLVEKLRGSGRGRGMATHAHRIREAVLTAQVGLALALLIAATLLAQSLYNLTRTQVGFSPEDIVTFSYDLPATSYQDAETQLSFYSEVLAQIREIPYVQAVGAVAPLPLEMGSVPTSWSLPPEVADAVDATVMAHMRVVTPDYFDAMGIRQLAGRGFDESDRGDSQQVALVNRALVDRYLAGREPVGTRITPGEVDAAESEWITIVGVVADVRFQSPRSEAEPEIYIPMQQFPQSWGHLVVRADVPPERLAGAVTDAVQRVDPNLPLADIKTGAEIMSDQFRISRISTTVTSLFAVMATALAVVGVLGLLSMVVAQRAREIGLRIALGARSRSIWRFVLVRGMRPVSIGLVFGTAISLGATRLLQSQVYGVSAINVLAFLLPLVGFTIVGLLACAVPSVRASRLDPVGLLQAE